uniref:RNA-directed DNA polymerase from mobile element jockey n=1 Tax=Anas zonorhyncha TaxID=75864 RepID=A0A8B9VCW6_9AVES
MRPKMSQRGRRPAWLNRELWLELRRKKRVYNLWKIGQATKEDYKDVARELAEELAKPLSIIYQQSWLSGEVPADWRLANVTPIYKKGRRADPGNYRPVSLTSVPGKLMDIIMRHLQGKQVIKPSQHGVIKGRSCLTNLISF